MFVLFVYRPQVSLFLCITPFSCIHPISPSADIIVVVVVTHYDVHISDTVDLQQKRLTPDPRLCFLLITAIFDRG